MELFWELAALFGKTGMFYCIDKPGPVRRKAWIVLVYSRYLNLGILNLRCPFRAPESTVTQSTITQLP